MVSPRTEGGQDAMPPPEADEMMLPSIHGRQLTQMSAQLPRLGAKQHMRSGVARGRPGRQRGGGPERERGGWGGADPPPALPRLLITSTQGGAGARSDYDDADDVAVSRSFAEGSARSSAGRRGGWMRQRRHARPRRAHRHSHAELTVVASRAGDDHKFEPPPVLSLESYASKESEAQVASKKRIGSGKPTRGGGKGGAKAEEERAQARQNRYMRLARGLVP